jgi:hypothetical protein
MSKPKYGDQISPSNPTSHCIGALTIDLILKSLNTAGKQNLGVLGIQDHLQLLWVELA